MSGCVAQAHAPCRDRGWGRGGGRNRRTGLDLPPRYISPFLYKRETTEGTQRPVAVVEACAAHPFARPSLLDHHCYMIYRQTLGGGFNWRERPTHRTETGPKLPVRRDDAAGIGEERAVTCPLHADGPHLRLEVVAVLGGGRKGTGKRGASRRNTPFLRASRAGGEKKKRCVQKERKPRRPASRGCAHAKSKRDGK